MLIDFVAKGTGSAVSDNIQPEGPFVFQFFDQRWQFHRIFDFQSIDPLQYITRLKAKFAKEAEKVYHVKFDALSTSVLEIGNRLGIQIQACTVIDGVDQDLAVHSFLAIC